MIPFNFASGRPPPPTRPTRRPKNSIDMDTDTVIAATDPMSITPDYPEGPSIRTLLGTTVGLLDDSQKDRVLSGPDSVLSFSTFHPLTASGRHGSDERRKLSARTLLDNAKRIVIETLNTGETFWRWVPRARGVSSASEEGTFPRRVLLCGQEVKISQEQWDIYKLDPFYDCYVPSDGSQSIISPDKGKEKGPPGPDSESSQSFSSSDGSSKRSYSRSGTEEAAPNAKRPSRRAYVESDAEDEDEVADLMKEEAAGPSFQDQKRRRRAEMEEQRRERRDKLPSSRFRSPGLVEDMIDLTMDDVEDIPFIASSSKRTMDEDVGEPAPKKKKLRRPSSPLGKDQFAKKARPRPKETYQERQERARKARDDAFLAELIAGAQGFTPDQARQYYEETRKASSSHQPNGNAEAANDIPDPVPLEEKIRRMREMNQQEGISSSRRRQAQEEGERARAEAEERDRLRAREARKVEEARIKAEEAKRRKQRENPSWAYGPWTPQRAHESYRSLSEYFDSMKFSAGNPITFEDVPWPVLHRPGSFRHTDVDWTSVEKFFQELEGHMRPQDYKSLLQTSQRRFHPDRWSSRRLWDGLSEDARMDLEMAQGTVSKAIGCLWEDFKQKR